MKHKSGLSHLTSQYKVKRQGMGFVTIGDNLPMNLDHQILATHMEIFHLWLRTAGSNEYMFLATEDLGRSPTEYKTKTKKHKTPPGVALLINAYP